MGRRCKTLLPMAGTLLQPRYATEEETRKLVGNRQRQEYYYNRRSKPLAPIEIGDTIRMQLPGQRTWNRVTCTTKAGPRSYEVQVEEGVYRRNRRQLLKTNEPLTATSPEKDNGEYAPPASELTQRTEQSDAPPAVEPVLC
ncbi:uncharacterized protein LOC116295052 [Actinia tenebrosa]|uniref:Uncharacterized protein LOC116295052 n=1 Tax=Actinia tenebrosa TaxID=6105 RepID=A0A6P8HT54_ACTTE|nr:uncharacterized protein LOC116295052 [Actinia tenebrosa]